MCHSKRGTYPPFGMGDQHRVLAAGVDIVAVEVAPKPPRLEPHYRIGLLIEGLVPPKDGEYDRDPLQPSAAPGQSLLNDIT